VIFALDLLLLPILVITALVALHVRDLAAATICFSAFSFFACIVYASLASVDVAFTEAMIGAGITSIVFLTSLYRTSRESKP
jgi:energy-converting hydrogenase B subunit D